MKEEEEASNPALMEALDHLRRASPPQYLSPSPLLASQARKASTHLFSSLLSLSQKPISIDSLLADDSFDAEQIWYQIDILMGGLAADLKRDLKRFEKMDPKEVLGLSEKKEEKLDVGERDDDDGFDDDKNDDDGFDDDKNDDDDLEDDVNDDDDDEDEDEDEDDLLIEHEYNPPDDGIGNDDQDPAIFAKYDDFFVDSSKKSSRNESKNRKEQSLDDFDEEESQDNSEADDYREDGKDHDEEELLSTFERQSMKLKADIERIETENLAPKTWTMTGEVAATKRPKNSALEVDLDFEHNRSRPPIVTEETTSIIEDIILKRIRESHFDDVQRRPTLSLKLPKEVKELDDNKSKKGLAEIYEEEYAQTAGLTTGPLSSSDELKNEANLLFKKLCLKLDALSHFHFAPKPVIEDMSIQANVPALAMEEIAPLAVSDAAMLAPEEIYSGKGDIKEEAELTQVDRKRRRAKKKRKFKAMMAQKTAKKARKTENVDQI